MNKKGFTLIELLATLIILSIVVTITVVGVTGSFNKAKEKSEEVFVGTIKDAMDVYLASDAKKLSFSAKCSQTLNKAHKSGVNVYKVNTTFDKVINSSYKPITQKELVNPRNKEQACSTASSIDISIYRDEHFVYYYKINKSEFNCLKNTSGEYDSVISNLPEGFVC